MAQFMMKGFHTWTLLLASCGRFASRAPFRTVLASVFTVFSGYLKDVFRVFSGSFREFGGYFQGVLGVRV